MANVIDLAMVLKFIRALALPFEKWPAYKSGVIDKNGNILVKVRDRDAKQAKTFMKFDLLVLKLKKLLGKVPGGKSRLATYAAALWLIKESESLENRDVESLTEEEIQAELLPLTQLVEENLTDEIVNAVGGGHIAGVGIGPDGEPGVHHKKKVKFDPRFEKKVKRRKSK